MKSRYFHYGLDDMEHWGVYFIEEALSPRHKKLLCPTKEELANELCGFCDDLDKLFALSKDDRDVLLYYRTKAKVLRDKKMVTYFDLYSSIGFSSEFMDMLHSTIHKRFLVVRKLIRDELKSMIPKEEAKKSTTKNQKKKAPYM